MSSAAYMLALKNDNTLWGCGYNPNGQLGLGDTNNRTTLTQITTNTNNIKSVYCGSQHTIILKNDGTLWGCGYNGQSQLGLGDDTSRTTFTQITTNTDNIKSIYCSQYHTLILKNDGTLWGCGDNSKGQLGLGDTTYTSTFTQITVNTNNIKSVYCGADYTFILKNDNTLWGCGNNQYGQLGLGDTDNKSIFTIIGINTNDIKSVHCGSSHTLILKNDGTLWGCGQNNYGQLGLGNTSSKTTIFAQITKNVNNIQSIYCGKNHTFILKNDSTLWGCGRNDSGQLGLGDTSYRTTFVQTITNVDNIKLIYCGDHQAFILKNDGTLWACGWNLYGQLGLGDKSNRTKFTQITTNANNIKCFADNYSLPNIVKIYDSEIGYIETLETNNFRNIPVDKFEKLKVLYAKPLNTYVNCLISFDKKQTWKTFNGTTWTTISDISPENIILNCMDIETLNNLSKQELIQAGFTGDLDFKVAIKTNNEKVTSSVSKIYIVYKNSF